MDPNSYTRKMSNGLSKAVFTVYSVHSCMSFHSSPGSRNCFMHTPQEATFLLSHPNSCTQINEQLPQHGSVHCSPRWTTQDLWQAQHRKRQALFFTPNCVQLDSTLPLANSAQEKADTVVFNTALCSAGQRPYHWQPQHKIRQTPVFSTQHCVQLGTHDERQWRDMFQKG